MKQKFLTVALALGALSAPLCAAPAPRYHVASRPSPDGFVAQAVNVHGVAAGYYLDPAGSGPYRAALVRQGRMSIEPDVGFNTLGTAVTPQGDMLGEVVDGGHCSGSPVVWPKGQPMQRLPVGCGGVPLAAHSASLAVGFEYSPTDPIGCAYWQDGVETRVWPQWGGDGECALRAIDSSGQYFAGYSSYSFSPVAQQHILLYTIAGGARDLGGVHGYPLAHANAVNVHGHTAGVAATDADFFTTAAFFHDGTKVTVLSRPSQNGVATAMDDRDQVVGFVTDSAPPYATHGMLWAKGRAYDLLTLMDHPEGWTDLRPGAIAADGRIAGVGTKDGVNTLFVLTPVRH